MQRKPFAVIAVLIVLLVSFFGTAAAQSGTDPSATPETPTPAPVGAALDEGVPTPQPGLKFFTHPIVKLLSAYFDKPALIPTPTDTEVVDPNNPAPDTSTTPEPPVANESGLGPIGEQIAAYHEDGMGFGVLVKLYAMVAASEEACSSGSDTSTTAAADEETPACTPLTAEELVAAFQGGTGMGQLFHEYGKPALLGVGHVRKEVKKQQEEQPTEPPVVGDQTQVTSDPGLVGPQMMNNGNSHNPNSNGKGSGKDKGPKAPKGPKK